MPSESLTLSTAYGVMLTSANTEYTLSLPADTRSFCIKPRDASKSIRVSTVQGIVASPTVTSDKYLTIQGGQQPWNSPVKLNLGSGLTLYLAAPSAVFVEVIVYTEAEPSC